MNPCEEDIIKVKIYKEFKQKYFSSRGDGKTRFSQLNYKDKLEFFREQRKYVEENYNIIINEKNKREK